MAAVVARAKRKIEHALRRRALAAFGDEVICSELASRLNQSSAHSPELLDTLVERMHGKAAGRLGERLLPAREIDHDRYGIRLVLSSPSVAVRLRPVEKEPFTVEWIERSVEPGDVFYDVGANVGAYSLIAAKAAGNQARVFAFEPAAPSFHDLVRNVLLNGCAESIVPLPLALSSETTLRSLALRSLAPGAARHRIRAEPEPDSDLTETILAVRLDDLVEGFGLPVPTHAKIDVDGYELEVLRGAERTLSRPEWRSIMVELDREDTERNQAVMTLLAGHGFGAGRRHARVPSRRYPRPYERPDVYWSFRREAA